MLHLLLGTSVLQPVKVSGLCIFMWKTKGNVSD